MRRWPWRRTPPAIQLEHRKPWPRIVYRYWTPDRLSVVCHVRAQNATAGAACARLHVKLIADQIVINGG